METDKARSLPLTDEKAHLVIGFYLPSTQDPANPDKVPTHVLQSLYGGVSFFLFLRQSKIGGTWMYIQIRKRYEYLRAENY